MGDALDARLLAAAFAELGKRLPHPIRLVIGGSGALVLRGQLARATIDCDVVIAQPDMGELQSHIRAVAEHQGLVGGWLNGSAQTYAEVLPPDYESRLHSLPSSGRLKVMMLDRLDVLVMKLFAGRPRDLADIATLAPTSAEIAFARAQLPRLGLIDHSRSERMRAVLDDLANVR
jgi:Nucleotidyltransferase of unknown function (DUF6036)